jgi:hypothetical protein
VVIGAIIIPVLVAGIIPVLVAGINPIKLGLDKALARPIIRQNKSEIR